MAPIDSYHPAVAATGLVIGLVAVACGLGFRRRPPWPGHVLAVLPLAIAVAIFVAPDGAGWPDQLVAPVLIAAVLATPGAAPRPRDLFDHSMRPVATVAPGALLLLGFGVLDIQADRWVTVLAVTVVAVVTIVGLLSHPDLGHSPPDPLGPATVFAMAGALWLAVPDTDHVVLLCGLLLPLAVAELAGVRMPPNPFAVSILLLVSVFDFRGRPAGTVLVAVVALLPVVGAAWADQRVSWRLGVLATTTAVAAAVARTAGLEHVVHDAVPTAVLGGLTIAAIAAVGMALRVRTARVAARHPGR